MRTCNLIKTQTATTATIDSAAFDLGDLQTYSIQVDFSGADVAGTLTLESSYFAEGPWTTVLNSSQSVTASADHTWSVLGAGYRFVRVHWVYTSGTGNITANLVGKETRVVGA